MANIFSFILGLASILFHCVNVSIFIFPFPRFRSFGSAAPMKLSEAKLLSFPLALLSSLPVILLGSFGPTGSHEEFDNELSHKPTHHDSCYYSSDSLLYPLYIVLYTVRTVRPTIIVCFQCFHAGIYECFRISLVHIHQILHLRLRIGRAHNLINSPMRVWKIGWTPL